MLCEVGELPFRLPVYKPSLGTASRLASVMRYGASCKVCERNMTRLASLTRVHANARDIGCEDVMDRENDALWRISLISENAGERRAVLNPLRTAARLMATPTAYMQRHYQQSCTYPFWLGA